MSCVSKFFALCIFSASAFFSASAQDPLSQILQPTATPTNTSNTAPVDPLGRATPSGTVLGFLQAAQAENYTIAAQYLQLSAARRQSEGEQLAIKLKTVMDKAFAGSLKHVSTLPEGAPQEGIPPGRQRLGTMSSGDVDVNLDLVRVTDPNVGKIWLISSDTLTKIPELYDQVEARRVESKLPKWLVKYEFAGMALWQWFALVLALPIAAGLAWLILALLEVPLRWWAEKRGQPGLQWHSVSAPIWLLAGTIVHHILSGYLGMPLLQRHYYGEVAAVAVIVSFNWILWRVIRWFFGRMRSRALAHGHAGTGSLVLLGERIVKPLIFVLAALAVFSRLGFDMTTALAGLGIGGIAIGFGAQQTIANLFGGVSVLGDEVIRVGDVCKFGDRTGVVEDIGLRSTRVRTEDRTLLVIPNGTVATINVENFSRRDKILFKTVLGFHLDTPAANLNSILSEIRRVVSDHPKIEKATVRVRLVELAPASLNVELLCYVLTQDFNEFAEIREELLLRIMHFVEDSGNSLASSQTLYLSDGAGTEKIKAVAKPATEKDGVTPKDSRKQG